MKISQFLEYSFFFLAKDSFNRSFIVDIRLCISTDIDILDQAILKLAFDYMKENKSHFILTLSSDNCVYDDIESVLISILKQLSNI